MKTLYLKLALVLAITSLSTAVFSQSYLENPNWGATVEERQANALTFNFFTDNYNNNNYDIAVPYLKELLVKAPKASQNIYVYGINIYKNKIAKATSLDQKKGYIDTMMLLYDKRIENFGDHATRGKGYIMSFKARDYLTYNPADREGIIKLFSEAIAENGDEVEPDILLIYFKELTDDYKADNIEADFLLNEYDRLIVLFDKDSNPEKEEAKKAFESYFISSGAANCDNLEQLFGAKIAANPSDLELLDKAVALLSRGNCKGDFFLSVAEKFYVLKPSSNTAMVLAAGFEEKKDFAKALKYLREAVANETDPATKSNLCVRIAGSELGAGNARTAADFAKQALTINPDNGYAQLILAQAYAAGASTACSDFARQSAFWLVYDTLAEARRMLSGDDNQIKGIDAQLSSLRQNFPTKEECFFRGLEDGTAYNVGCGWISGRTAVRSR